MSALPDTLHALYRTRQYDAALEQALALAADPQLRGEALGLAAQCAVGLDRVDHLSKLIGAAEQGGVIPASFLARVLLRCLDDDMLDQLVSLGRLVPEGNPVFPITTYYAACAHMVAGREDEAQAGFNRFRLTIRPYVAGLPMIKDGYLNLIFRQGTLVLPPAETAERIAQVPAGPEPQADFRMIRPFQAAGVAPGTPLVMGCGDARYVSYFARDWAASLGPQVPRLHIHVINPDADALAALDAVAAALPPGVFLSASTSEDAHYRTATAYACGRFFVVPRLLAQVGRPVVTIDLDAELQPGLLDLVSLAGAADFACFETGRREPASAHQASIMVFADSDPSRRFLSALGAFCRAKLDQTSAVNWLLDQAALYSVLRLFRRAEPDFRYAALDRLSGKRLDDVMRSIATDQQKNEMRLQGLFTPAQQAAQAAGHLDMDWQP
jgi:hypothetical protein